MNTQKIALITGANRGIGKEIARELAAQGITVMLTARDPEKGKRAAAELKSAGEVIFHPLDMVSEESMTALTNFVTNKFGKLDILVNNAGIMGSHADSIRATMADFRHTMETNFYGPLQLSRMMVPLLKKSASGRIINISSGMGALKGMSGGSADYRISKTALNSLTAIMAADLAGTPLRINTMCPGWVKTDMGGAGASRSVEQGAETAVWLALEKNIPTGKFFRDKKIIDW